MKLMAKINHWWLCFLLSFLLAIIFTLVFCLLLLANQSPISPKQTSSSTAPPAVTTASDAGKQATIKQESALLSILTTGDVMLGRSVNYLGNKYQDYGWSLAKVSPFLQQFSYVVANLENPIIKDCPLTNEGMIFCSSEPSAAALKKAHFNLLTLANNHINNYGESGVEQTKQLLRQNGLDFAVEKELLIKDFAHQRIGFLAFDDTVTTLDEEEFFAQVAAAAAQVDVLFVSLHFGIEYQYQPTARQKQLAQGAIVAGADVILGNHSHWFGPLEFYQHGVIIYSHGNFVFDQMWSEQTKQGLAIAWYFNQEAKLTQIKVYPIYISNYGLANLATDEAVGEQILNKFIQVSALSASASAGVITLDL